jgi:CDP-diglyceride synthetase
MDASRILFAPFLVYSKMSESLLPKFLLSILFPLSILLLFRTRALRDRYYMLGLLLFLMGAIQSYFFAESGIRIFKGNFLWSGQLGLFLWFVISLRFVVQQFYSERAEPRWSATYIALSGIFALHVVSGIIWYVLETTSPGAYWPLVQASTA